MPQGRRPGKVQGFNPSRLALPGIQTGRTRASLQPVAATADPTAGQLQQVLQGATQVATQALQTSAELNELERRALFRHGSEFGAEFTQSLLADSSANPLSNPFLSATTGEEVLEIKEQLKQRAIETYKEVNGADPLEGTIEGFTREIDKVLLPLLDAASRRRQAFAQEEYKNTVNRFSTAYQNGEDTSDFESDIRDLAGSMGIPSEVVESQIQSITERQADNRQSSLLNRQIAELMTDSTIPPEGRLAILNRFRSDPNAMRIMGGQINTLAGSITSEIDAKRFFETNQNVLRRLENFKDDEVSLLESANAWQLAQSRLVEEANTATAGPEARLLREQANQAGQIEAAYRAAIDAHHQTIIETTKNDLVVLSARLHTSNNFGRQDPEALAEAGRILDEISQWEEIPSSLQSVVMNLASLAGRQFDASRFVGDEKEQTSRIAEAITQKISSVQTVATPYEDQNNKTFEGLSALVTETANDPSIFYPALSKVVETITTNYSDNPEAFEGSLVGLTRFLFMSVNNKGIFVSPTGEDYGRNAILGAIRSTGATPESPLGQLLAGALMLPSDQLSAEEAAPILGERMRKTAAVSEEQTLKLASMVEDQRRRFARTDRQSTQLLDVVQSKFGPTFTRDDNKNARFLDLDDPLTLFVFQAALANEFTTRDLATIDSLDKSKVLPAISQAMLNVVNGGVPTIINGQPKVQIRSTPPERALDKASLSILPLVIAATVEDDYRIYAMNHTGFTDGQNEQVQRFIASGHVNLTVDIPQRFNNLGSHVAIIRHLNKEARALRLETAVPGMGSEFMLEQLGSPAFGGLVSNVLLGNRGLFEERIIKQIKEAGGFTSWMDTVVLPSGRSIE